MKSPVVYLLAMLSMISCGVRAQGTFVYDQQSSTDENYPFNGLPFQVYGTIGQSFTPVLPAVGFVRLKVGDLTLGNALGATLVVNLRANAINGPVLGTTSPVILADSFRGSTDFFFANPVAVVPNTTYFFETVVQSGDNWGITDRADSRGDVNYLGGVLYGGLTPASAADLWFREGIVVPEPSSVALLMGGGISTWLIRRKQRRR